MVNGVRTTALTLGVARRVSLPLTGGGSAFDCSCSVLAVLTSSFGVGTGLIGLGVADAEGKGEGVVFSVGAALGNAAITTLAGALGVIGFDSPLNIRPATAAPIDNPAAIAANHRDLFDVRDVGFACSLWPHFKQNDASLGNSVPHF